MENTTQLVPGRAVQLQQVPRPSVRALDAGPVLPSGRVLRPGRLASPIRPAATARSAARRSKAPSRLVRDHLRHRRRRSEARTHGSGRAADVPLRPRRQTARRRSRREQLAQWITSKDNQYFAKSYVNRLWGYLLGVGLIEPIDDIRAGNPPTNPELLDALTKEFIEQRFRRPAHDADDLQVADVSAFDRDEQVERGRHDQLFARAGPAAAGRGAVRRDPRRHRLDAATARRAGRLPRGAASRRGRELAVPGRFRPAAA